MSITTNPKGRSLEFAAFQETLATLSQADQERHQWLWGYFHGPLRRDKDAISKELGAQWQDIQLLLSGGALSRERKAEIHDAIDTLKRRAEKKKPLVKTIVVERMLQVLDYVRDNSAMAYITGPTGRGKTYTAESWALANNHGRTKYIRIPSDCSKRGVLMELSRLCGCAAKGNTVEMTHNIMRAIGPRNVVIVDEAGHLLSRSGKAGGPIEFFRDLHDKCGCGVCLIFTDVYLKEIKNGASADYFEQFLGRFEFNIEIPKVPRRDEVRSILENYFSKLNESAVSYALSLTRQRDGKLRTLFKDLNRADEYARSKGKEITLEDLKAAAEWRKSVGAWPEDI